jgi:NADPH:quinone reductase-like Zn-dependent oxidoreductase
MHRVNGLRLVEKTPSVLKSFPYFDHTRYPGQPSFPFVPGYDFVGTVLAVGAGADQDLLGKRVAAVTKTGGWATHVIVLARDLVPVPLALDPALVETV